METEHPFHTTLSNLGIPALNALQETAAPAIQAHPNVILLAPTGSGKTLAFLLPVFRLLKIDTPGVQCLVLSPTRELAIQIERVWQKMATGFKVNTCYGGHSMQTEIRNLSQPPALLIGTPGRVLEHVSRKTVDLRRVRLLVLDEFDKSLSMGFQEQMADIIKGLHFLEKRILASATDKQHIPAFTGIANPKVLNFYKAAEKSTDGLVVKRVLASTGNKDRVLFQLLCFLGRESTLIFCNQRDSTERVSAFLAGMRIPNAYFHGKMEQPDREKVLVQFRNGSIIYLVASDLAARGLDIPEVKNVIHYELPTQQKDYLHRNGRTARMHADGTAYILLQPDEPLPAYLPEAPPLFEIPRTDSLPEPSPWITLYISGGKKDKLSKTDIVGFLSKKGNLQQENIGKIEVLDFMSFVAVKKEVAAGLLEAVRPEKMKGKKYKIVVTS
ncbi:MAG: DEAD/DEAH box helicase [Saprospirales bacterium]|nr:DEAD/DEAH box helicase [Saprospirales bacterium]